MERLAKRSSIIGLIALLQACGSADGPLQRELQIGGASGSELAAVQVLHWGNGAEPQSIDPHRGEGVPGANIGRELFESLVEEAPNGDLVPGAAESWEISDDGKTYTFALRPNARWSNGDPVTAADWVYGLRRSLDPATGSRYTFILEPILNAVAVAAGQMPVEAVGVRAIGEHTLEIELENATPYFLGLLTHSASYAMHRASTEQHGDRVTRAGNFVTNGAYMLDEWVVQSHLKLVRNPYYWDNASTTIDEVYFHNTEDRSAEISRYRADEIDITATSMPTSQLRWIRENLVDELVVAPYLGSYYYGLNLEQPPFKDNLPLRKALALAIDRKIIVEQVLRGGQLPAFGWVPPVINYTPQQMPEADWTQQQRNEEAKRLYSQAGYSDDNPLAVEILYNTDENHKNVAVAIGAMWSQVLGVKTSILNQEWKVYLDTRRQKIDTEVFRAGWIGDYNDANTFASMLLSTSQLNDSGYNSPEYDELVSLAAAEGDLEKRRAYLEEAERMMLSDLPIIPIYYYTNTRLVKPWVAGYESNIMDHHHSRNFRILAH